MEFDLTAKIYTDEDAAWEHYEKVRWPNGEPVCPHCGSVGNATKTQGKTTRKGLYNCRDCDKPFTATVGTIFEDGHIPMHKWLMAVRLIASSKKGISAHQLMRTLGFGSYRTAWFMAHRIRESMRELHPNESGTIGGEGKTVETDTTYIGGKERNKHRRKRRADHIGGVGKEAVFSLVERGGKVHSHHMPEVSARTLRPILDAQIKDAKRTALMTDGEGQYRILVDMFGSHEFVNHGIGEYVRGNVHTNTVESYFALLKRGIIGCYFHISQKHLKRYLGEFDFRYNTRSALGVEDTERADLILRGTVGKRLMYQRPARASAPN
jgi:transposase-like protein